MLLFRRRNTVRNEKMSESLNVLLPVLSSLVELLDFAQALRLPSNPVPRC